MLRLEGKSLIRYPEQPDLDSKSYATDVIVWTDAFTIVKDDSCCFTKENKKVFNLMKQHSTPSMIQKLHTHDDWDQVEDDMDGVSLSKLLRYYCDRKGAGEKKQMLNLVQACKYVFFSNVYTNCYVS